LNKYCAFFLLCLCSFFISGFSNPFADIAQENIQDGNKLYNEKKYDEALGKYTEALRSNSDLPILHYNIGNTLYQQKKYMESIAEYQKMLGSEKLGSRSKAHYNMGNAYYRLNKLQESESHYKKALETGR